ncbi:MAG: hypothetical protein QY310_02000 [Candidatus Jettenia sp. CY-1]|nr:MAG: hypothetical protein QY310_02000 [Candidatus Jettenia sp. CY-1]
MIQPIFQHMPGLSHIAITVLAFMGVKGMRIQVRKAFGEKWE